MKAFVKLICVILALAIGLAVPASAEANARASLFFHTISTSIYKINDTQFQVWFDVGAVDGMDELGASKITVQRSEDGENWQNMFTYRAEYYPQMIDYNTIEHGAYVPYHGTQGYHYRAFVTFYAKNSSGSGNYTAIPIPYTCNQTMDL